MRCWSGRVLCLLLGLLTAWVVVEALGEEPELEWTAVEHARGAPLLAALSTHVSPGRAIAFAPRSTAEVAPADPEPEALRAEAESLPAASQPASRTLRREGLDRIEEGLKLLPLDVDAGSLWAQLGSLHREAGRPEDALRCFLRAGDWGWSGWIQELSSLPPALTRGPLARRALDCPDDGAVAEALFGVHVALGETTEALEVCVRVLERGGAAERWLSRVLEVDPVGGRAILEGHVSRHPEAIEVYGTLAMLDYEAGDHRAAALQLARALPHMNRAWPLARAIGELDTHVALTSLTSLLREQPERGELWLALGRVHLLDESPAAALAAFEQAYWTGSIEAVDRIASLDPARAVAVVGADPNADAGRWGDLGAQLYHRNQFREALACFERGRTLSGDGDRWEPMVAEARRRLAHPTCESCGR